MGGRLQLIQPSSGVSLQRQVQEHGQILQAAELLLAFAATTRRLSIVDSVG